MHGCVNDMSSVQSSVHCFVYCSAPSTKHNEGTSTPPQTPRPTPLHRPSKRRIEPTRTNSSKFRRIGRFVEHRRKERERERSEDFKHFVKSIDHDARRNLDKSLSSVLKAISDGIDVVNKEFGEESHLFRDMKQQFDERWDDDKDTYHSEVSELWELFQEDSKSTDDEAASFKHRS
jgi:hypothetical protein